MGNALFRSIGLLILAFTAAGCCGAGYMPNVAQGEAWVAKGLTPGTTVEDATAFLEARGCTVWEYRSASNRRELVGRHHAGTCLASGTSDYLFIRSDLDETGHVLSSRVSHETGPGLK